MSSPPQQALSVEALLTLQTISEQQRIITDMQEIIAALKRQVGSLQLEKKQLEQSQPSLPPLTVLKELKALREAHATLQAEADGLRADRAHLEDERANLSSRVEELRVTASEQARGLQELGIQEARSSRERSVLLLTETRCRRLELEVEELKTEMDAMTYDKKRWRALVEALVSRLEPGLQSHMRVQIDEMQRTELEGRSARMKARNKCAAMDKESQSCDVLGVPLSTACPTHQRPHVLAQEAQLDPLDILAVWSKANEAEPRGTLDAILPSASAAVWCSSASAGADARACVGSSIAPTTAAASSKRTPHLYTAAPGTQPGSRPRGLKSRFLVPL